MQDCNENYYRAMTANAVSAPKTDEKSPLLLKIDEELRGKLEWLAEISNRADAVATKVFGSLPEAQSGGSPRPVRSGVIGDIQDKMDVLRDRMEHLAGAITRLEMLA